MSATRPLRKRRSSGTIRLGYVPLCDCAPLVAAEQLGLFSHCGLEVVLVREAGWATVLDKIVFGELEAAHAVVGLPFASALGLRTIPKPCLVPLILSLHGNAITLARHWWDRGICDGFSLRQAVVSENRRLTFGVVSLFSSHHFLLRQWIWSVGIPLQLVRICVVPPPQMPDHLAAGHLDGFCAGEPWNSVAVQRGAGWCPITSGELAPLHPEKLLVVSQPWAEHNREECLRLVAALISACQWCDEPENREKLVSWLSSPRYLHLPEEMVRPSLVGPFSPAPGKTRALPDFLVFHRFDTNRPTRTKALWVWEKLQSCLHFELPVSEPPWQPIELFSEEMYLEALELGFSMLSCSETIPR
ncbi:Nitrate ABC transporter, ATP binding protein [Candidatus Methylacidithermus pantelleriae]|uniref:Nitrate ABC transporter, ATP binding protein n=2 Tax=Candidatus Methylacidithermus pantelleriae TaxID=2744239 RepID=A0A8J2BJ40_9BACT|nr:Nitrate ABC transporter, ATP binding protein [Candidatus Methylacidithermus pantelleriae]